MLKATEALSVETWLEAVLGRYDHTLRDAAQYTLERQDNYLDLKDDFAQIVTALNDGEQEKACEFIVECLPIFVSMNTHIWMDIRTSALLVSIDKIAS
ncbi:hypothetical protein BCU00_019795 [Vibrio breoganii]|uniref:hypothetical protein n=1 Tax=Vibrio breoganii TaxID=553239 RepID=UPI0039A668DC